jgi:hypothetical protein
MVEVCWGAKPVIQADLHMRGEGIAEAFIIIGQKG